MRSTTMMRSIKAWAFKLPISIKRLPSKISAIVGETLAVCGGIATVVELATLAQVGFLVVLFQDCFWLLFAAALIYGIWHNWPRLEHTVMVADSPDVSITLKVCDILDCTGAVIIPTNTTFDTTMKDDFISPGSVQGQYQLRHFRGSLGKLDEMMGESLNGKSFVLLDDGRTTKLRRYPIGTVCKVNQNGKRAYFLADSDINANGIAINADAAAIAAALVGLWDSLAVCGNREPYSVPLLGTGKAGAKDVSRNEIVEQIIVSFLAATKERKITEKLTICVHPMDYEKIDWDELCECLRYRCTYANRKVSDG